MPYDIFLSYARKDNEVRDPGPDGTPEGWVTALHRHILEDHRRFSTEELRIFFDVEAIAGMDDWRHRILGGLRDSRILLVCLSPNYLASEYCRWELEEYQRRQVHQLMGSDSVASVYFVEAPGGTDADRAQLLSELSRRQHAADFRPWFPAGPRALLDVEVQRQLAKLGQSLWERLDRARRAVAVPGNLRRQNPHFVGRREETRRLHERAYLGAVGLVTALQGLGGIGKTELAVAYANAFADCYPGGLWSLPAEGERELLALIGRLAYEPALGYPLRPEDKDDPQRLGRAVLAHLRERALAGGSPERSGRALALLLLDNVSEATLLSPEQLATLPRDLDAGWLAIIATTRLDLKEHKQQLAIVAIDALDEDSALALMREHQPLRNIEGEDDATHRTPRFANSEEEEAARSIVRLLGGFTLAVEQVAVYLGLHPEVAPSRFLPSLQDRGVTLADSLPERDEEVASGMRAAHKQLGLILHQTLAHLDTPTRAALDFAALLPADSIPWPWLRTLVLAKHPELGDVDGLGPDPWLEVKRRLQGLHLLIDGDPPELARMHRLVKAHLSRGCHGSAGEVLVGLLLERAGTVIKATVSVRDWEIDALLSALSEQLARSRIDFQLARIASLLADSLQPYRPLSRLVPLLTQAHDVLERCSSNDPANVDLHRNVSWSHRRLGDMARTMGNPPEAEHRYRLALEIDERSAGMDPLNADLQRALWRSQRRLGNLAREMGNLAEAEQRYRLALQIAESLAAADPADPDRQLDLSESHYQLRDHAGARRHFNLAQGFAERVSPADPSNTNRQRGLAALHFRLGIFARMMGYLEEAQRHYRLALEIQERLAATDPLNPNRQHDMSESLVRMGELARAMGNREEAQRHYRLALEIHERLAATDPLNANRQHDLSESLVRMGDVAQQMGNLEEAQRHYRLGLEIQERLAATDPRNTNRQRDLSESLFQMGALLAQGMGDPEETGRYYRLALEIDERLAGAEPLNANRQRQLSETLVWQGELAEAMGDLAEAKQRYRLALDIDERLAAAVPRNADVQRRLAQNHEQLGGVLDAMGDFLEAESCLRRALEIRKMLAAADPSNADRKHELARSHEGLGDLAKARGKFEESARHFSTALAILENLAVADDPGKSRLARDVRFCRMKLETSRRRQHAQKSPDSK